MNTKSDQAADSVAERFELDLGFAVSRLAHRLTDTAPLIRLLASASTPARYRQALNAFVGPDELMALAMALLDLSSLDLSQAHTSPSTPVPNLRGNAKGSTKSP